MAEITSQIKLALLVMGISFVASLIGGFSDYMVEKNQWGVKIDNKLLSRQSAGSSVSLDHEFGDNIPNDLIIKIHDDKGNTFT